MKKLLVALLGMAAAGCCLFNCDGPDATAISPDGRNEIRLWASPLAYEVARDGVVVVAKTPIGLKLDGRCLCEDARLTDVSKRKVEGCVATPVYRKAKVCLCGNETYAKFGDWGVRLAARNDGVAYRFETAKGGTVRVTSEKASVTIPCPKAEALVYKTRTLGCEETVPSNIPAGEIKTEKNESVYLPLVYTVGGKTVAVTDSDVRNYPWWYLKRGETADAAKQDECQRSLDAFFAYMGREKKLLSDSIRESSGAYDEILRDQKKLAETMIRLETENARRSEIAATNGWKRYDKAEMVMIVLKDADMNALALKYLGEDFTALRAECRGRIKSVLEMQSKTERRLALNRAKYRNRLEGIEDYVDRKTTKAQEITASANKDL